MSLESNIADLVKSANGLTDAVHGKMAAIDKRVEVHIAKMDGAMANWGTAANQTLEVGQGKAFATIQDAWGALRGKVLRHEVKIKVSDGIYKMNSLVFSDHPYAHKVRVEGNLLQPSACVLSFVPDANQRSHGVQFVGVRGINFSGFKIVGECDKDKNITWRGISLTRESYVESNTGSIEVQGAYNGIELSYGSLYICPGIRVSEFYAMGVQAHDSSRVTMTAAVLKGKGKENRFMHPDGKVRDAIGIKAEFLSMISANDAVIEGVSSIGVFAANSSIVYASGVQVRDCGNYGVYSGNGATIQIHALEGKSSKVTGCKIGVCARSQGAVYGSNLIVQEAEKGIYADLLGTIQVINSEVSRCSVVAYEATKGAYIDAPGSAAKSVENKVKYSPANSGVSGNFNATILFS